MSDKPLPYRRVDLDRISIDTVEQDTARGSLTTPHIRWGILPLAVLLCTAQNLLSILANNRNNLQLTASMIPVVTYAALVVLMLMINPLLRLIRVIRPLARGELLCLFCAMLVTSGIGVFGLTSQLVPMVATPWNPEWATPQSGWQDDLQPHLNPNLYITDTDVIREFREGIRLTAPDGRIIHRPRTTDSLAEKWDYGVRVFRQIRWPVWLKPLGFWLVFVGASYGFFYCLSYLVLRYWWLREKLIFPLARLPESLMPQLGQASRWVPAIFTRPGFWIGFALASTVMSWNAANDSGWVLGVGRIDLGIDGKELMDMLAGTGLAGITGKTDSGMAILIIFTAVSIAYLLPLDISFSVWFYFLLGRAVLLAGSWMGYSENADEFTSTMWWSNNPVTAQGGGALLLFSAVSLYRCLKDYAHLAAGRGLAGRLRLFLPVVGMVLCLGVMVGWLHWNRLPLLWGVLGVGFLTLMTVGLMRIVAEGGIYWFQSHAGFFHAYRIFGLGKALATTLVAPLLLIYSVLFLDLKTFLAPNLLNAARLQGQARLSRMKFHLTLGLCILASVVVCLGFEITLAHIRGGQQMNIWFHNISPKLIAERAAHVPADVESVQWDRAAWYGVGAGWTALSLLLRRSLFWFPHPIGYVMLINPLMGFLWFSFLLGWIAKKCVVKYGGRSTFESVKIVFMGLMLGEILAIFAWSIVALFVPADVNDITLNRYTP